jgi:hypothetical protein
MVKKEISASVKKTRSCGYPLFALPRAIELARALCEGFGEGPHSRESAARGLGYSSFSGAASSKIGSLVHFGLLARASGMYSITSLAKSVFLYPKEGSGEAIVTVAIKPALYGKLISRFLDKPLPERLEEILSADYGITGKAAPAAARNFIETMEFAGLMKDGTLVFMEAGFAVDPQKIFDAGSVKENNDNRAVKNRVIKINLLSGVEIIFPEDLAYRISMGEFADEIKSLDKKAGGVE